MRNVDARGKACPMPVLMAKKEVDAGCDEFSITVDNRTAVENISRFGRSSGFSVVEVEGTEDVYTLELTKVENQSGENKKSDGKAYAVFVGKKGIGQGDDEFSEVLLTMYLYALTETDRLPDYILFMNEGVYIPTANGDNIEHLRKLSELGVEILVCGACLNYYKLEDSLKVGQVSNMYSINEAMIAVDKVITL